MIDWRTESPDCNDAWDKYRAEKIPGPRQRQPTYHEIWIDAWNTAMYYLKIKQAKDNSHDGPR